MTTTNHLPNTLRHHRERVGLRQTDIAELLGLQCSDRLSRWKHGIAMPSVTNLFKLAALYDVTPHALYSHLFGMLQEQSRSEGKTVAKSSEVREDCNIATHTTRDRM